MKGLEINKPNIKSFKDDALLDQIYSCTLKTIKNVDLHFFSFSSEN